jgi:vacuolar protein sorting-associated protein VTA1
VTPPQSDELTLEDELTAHMDISAASPVLSPVVSPTATVHTSPMNSAAPHVSPATNHVTSDDHVTPSYTVTNHVTTSPINHVPAPVTRAPEPVPIQTRQAGHVPSDHVTAQGYKPMDDAVIEAQKYAKYVVSALQFDDVNTAVVNLKRCYSLLTGLPL